MNPSQPKIPPIVRFVLAMEALRDELDRKIKASQLDPYWSDFEESARDALKAYDQVKEIFTAGEND